MVILLTLIILLPFPSPYATTTTKNIQFPHTLTPVTPSSVIQVAAQLAPTARSRTHSPMRQQGAPASLVSMETDTLALVSWLPGHQITDVF